MVWPIILSRIFVNVHLSYIYFLVLKMSWKIVSGRVKFDRYFPFQGFHQVFFKGSCFFCFKSLQEIWIPDSIVWPYIFHLENIRQFLSKAHSDQDKIWIEPYCPLKDSTYISTKNSFLLFEIFLKILIRDNTDLFILST